MTRLYDGALAPSGIRITQLSILVAVTFYGPFTINALAQALLMDRTTLTADLKPLERQGFISVERGQDRRTRRISVTRLGLTRLEQAIPLWHRAQGQIEERFGLARLKAMLGELREVTHIAEHR